MNDPQAFIFHHTGGGGTIEGVRSTLRQRGLGAQYVMDRDGNIMQIGGPGSSHMLPGWGIGAGLNNGNTVGMEVIAKNNKDVTPQQIKAAQAFIAQNYPHLPIYGHGEVNPGHKEADEGMAIVNAIRSSRNQPPIPPAPIPNLPGSPLDMSYFMKARGQPDLPLFAPAQPPPQAPAAQAPSPSFFSTLSALGPSNPTDLQNWYNRQIG
jgi:hypothetical protein